MGLATGQAREIKRAWMAPAKHKAERETGESAPQLQQKDAEKSRALNRPWKPSVEVGKVTESQREMLPAMRRTGEAALETEKHAFFNKKRLNI